MNDVLDTPETFAAPQTTATPRSLVRSVARKLLAERTTALAMVDQAFYSGTTFVTSVLVGRLAGADALGAYSLAFTLSVLVMCTHETLVTMPLTIFVHRLNAARKKRAAGSAAMMYLAMSLLAAIGFFAASAMLTLLGRNTTLAATLLTLAGVVPLVLLRELARKIAFAHLELVKATLVDGATSVLQISLLVLLAALGQLTAVTALAAMGTACGVAGVAWAIADRRRFTVRPKQLSLDVQRHWRLGRWIFAALITFMMQGSLLMWLVALMLDTAASGVFAAALSVVALSNPLINAIGGVFTPQACRALHHGGRKEVRRIALRKTVLLSAAAGCFALFLAAFGDAFVGAMYGDEYTGHWSMLAMLALVAFAKAVEIIAYNGLYVVERAHVNLWINLVGLVGLAMVASPAMHLGGLNGAALALLFVTVLSVVVRWFCFLQIVSE